MTTLKNKILKNGIATGLQKSIKVFEQLLLIPFFISAWGVAYYGEWLTLTIIPTVLAFSNFGFGTAAANSFVLKFTSDARKDAADIFKTGFIIITITIFCGVLLSCIVLFILNEFNVFEKSLIIKEHAIWSVSILVLARLINFYTQLFTARYIALRKASLSINLLTVNSLLNLGVGLLILTYGLDVVVYSLGQLFVTILFNVFYIYRSFRVLGFENNYKGVLKKKYVTDITQKGIGYLMLPIWQSIYFQGTIFVVRIILGPESVVIFNTARKLTRTINQIFIMVNGTVFPELQYEIGKGNTIRVQKLFIISLFVVLMVAFLGVIILLLFGLDFYNVWTKNKLEVPVFMWNILILGILFNALWWTASMVYTAINKPLFFAKLGMLSALLSVICSFFLAKIMGLNGVAIGSLLLDVILAIIILPNIFKILQINIKDFYLEILAFSKLLLVKLGFKK